jgi:hypothetical protein
MSLVGHRWRPVWQVPVSLGNLPPWWEAGEGRLEAKCHWLIPVILATWEAKIRRMTVQGQPGKIAHKISSLK